MSAPLTAPRTEAERALRIAMQTSPRDALPPLELARLLIEQLADDLRRIESAIPGGMDRDCYQRDEAGEAVLAAVAGLADLLGDTIKPAITAIEQARADAEPAEPVASLRQHAYPGRF